MANLSLTTATTFGKRNQLSTTLLYYFIFVLLGLVGVYFGPAIPSLAEQTRSGLSQISFINSRLAGRPGRIDRAGPFFNFSQSGE